MARTKLKDRKLPFYTKGQEIFNMTSHIVGAVFGFVALLICVVVSTLHLNWWALTASIIYGCSLIVLFTMSSVYHGLPIGMPKKVLQVLDHCTIYLLIAGSYMPVTLSGMRPVYPVFAWILFGVITALTVVATTLTAIDLKRYQKFSVGCYVGMGWCIVLSVVPVVRSLGLACFLLILIGGLFYTVGTVLYVLGKKKHSWWHCVFHVFVLIGAFLQFLAIVKYCI